MTVEERNKLLDKAVANGWDDGEVMAAYFEACFNNPDDLIFMARSTVQQEPSEGVGSDES